MAFDPERILKVLAEHDVEHIVVGGIGAVLHGSPMPTDDLDVVPELVKPNLEALAGALNALGARILSHEAPAGIAVEWTAKDLQRWIVELRFFNLSTDFGRLDLIDRPAGTAGYRDLATSAETFDLDDVQIRVAALADIIRSKEAAGRQRDLEQLPTLRLLLERTTE
jgi:hypothetical protein